MPTKKRFMSRKWAFALNFKGFLCGCHLRQILVT